MRRHLKRWMRPERRAASLEFLLFRNRVFYHRSASSHHGAVELSADADAGAADRGAGGGNRAMIKPSELLPETANLLQTAIADFFLPER